jgi:acylphosphatase
MKAMRIHVSGRVQGVGYRQGCRQTARSVGLVGWARNLRDGRVEVFAQGADQALDTLVTWLWAGPPGAHVTGVEADVVAPDPTLADFLIQPDPR